MKIINQILALIALTGLGACVVENPTPSQYPQQYPQSQPYPAPAPQPAVIYPAPPPSVRYEREEIRRCDADNRRAHAEVMDIYNRANRAGRIDPAEAQRFNAMQIRLNNIVGRLNRGGLTLQECQYISGEIANERQEVTRMSRFDPETGRCVADNRAAHNAVYTVYNDGVRAGRISGGEAQRFAAIEKRLAEYQAQARRDGLTISECQNIGRAIAREWAIVESMIRRP